MTVEAPIGSRSGSKGRTAAWIGLVLLIFSGTSLFLLWPEIGVGPDQGAGVGIYVLLLLVVCVPLMVLAFALIVIGVICDGIASSRSAEGTQYAPLKYPLADPVTPKETP